MPNYNRNQFSSIENKQDVNSILNIKKGRADKTFSFNDSIIDHSSIINEVFLANGSRIKETNDESMYNYKNSKDLSNKEIEKENSAKNKMFNNIELKKKLYYDKLNMNSKNNNNEKEYMIHNKNLKGGDEHLNKNYMDRKYIGGHIVKDRSKFRRLEQFNDESNLNANSSYNHINSKSSNIQRNHNEYNTFTKEMLIKNKKSHNNNSFSNNQKQKYDCNQNSNENYENFNKKNMAFKKKHDYNYPNKENSTNLKFSVINRNPKAFLPTELNDSMVALPSSYAQRDINYHRKINEGKGNNLNKENFKDDINKEDLINEDFPDNNTLTDNRITNINNEFQRNTNAVKGMTNATSFITKEKNMMLPLKKNGNSNKYNEDINEERINNNNLLMYHNSSIRDKYHNYPTTKKDTSIVTSKNIVDKDAKRTKEYHNLSLSTIDSNYSNQNAYENNYTLKFLDSHHPSRKDNIMDNNLNTNLDYAEEKKIPIGDAKQEGKYINANNAVDKNLCNKIASRDYKYTSEYDYNLKKGNKQPFKNDNVQTLSTNIIGKQRFLDKEETDAISKNYEYNKNDNVNSSPEFGNDSMNNITYDNRLESVINENKMPKGNIIDGSREYKNAIKNKNQYSSPKYDDKKLRKQAKNIENMVISYLNKNTMNYDNASEEDYNRYHSSDSYNNKIPYENMNDELKIDEYLRNDKNYYNKKLNYQYVNERGINRPCQGSILNTREKYKNNSHSHIFKKYPSECYPSVNNAAERKPAYDDYRDGTYTNAQYSDIEKHEDVRNYPNNFLYDSQNEKESLTVIRLPAENKKQVKKKKKKIDYGSSLVDMYSTAIPLSDKVDSYALKVLSNNESVDKKIYALIPKSVVEVTEYDDITHVTLQSPSPLFVNPNMSVKQHILTTNYHQKNNEIPKITSCVIPISDESLKDSMEMSKESLNIPENDKNIKSIIKDASLKNKSASSLSVKFKLENSEFDNKLGNENKINMISQNEDNIDKSEKLNKKIGDNILTQELKNLKIDKNETEKKRASIFDESRIKSKNGKKKDLNNKIVLDSSKVKKATEIKLKKIQHVTGLLEKYDIPNPFEKYFMEPIEYSQLVGKNEKAKLLILALTVSNNYYKFIIKSMERAEIKEVFNEKRKKMILKLITLLGNQINSDIKKKFSDANAIVPSKEDDLKKEESIKPKMSTKEKEIKIEEHKLICQYWEKQCECMGLLIKEWNKICEILESINIDPNNIVNSLISLYGEKTISDFHLSFDEIKKANIELDVNIDDVSIPNMEEATENKIDPSSMTIMNLIQDIKWDMDFEYSLNQIREDWKNENKHNKKLIQQKIIEGVNHRIGLLDYLNKVEVNINAFAKLIEKRMISNDDVKSQLRSMQDLNDNLMLSKLLEKLKSNQMDINVESFKTPTSFFASHYLPLTLRSVSEGSGKEDSIYQENHIDKKKEDAENVYNKKDNRNDEKGNDNDEIDDKENFTIESKSDSEQKS